MTSYCGIIYVWLVIDTWYLVYTWFAYIIEHNHTLELECQKYIIDKYFIELFR